MFEPLTLTEILQEPEPISIELSMLPEPLMVAVAVGIMLLAPVCVPIVVPPGPLEAMLD